jgi:hypothetical protein
MLAVFFPSLRFQGTQQLATDASVRLKHAMDCKKLETFFKKTDFTGSDIAAAKIPAGSKEKLPADYKCGAALAKTYKDKPSACSGFKGVASARACCEKCSSFPACEYWSFGTSGQNIVGYAASTEPLVAPAAR